MLKVKMISRNNVGKFQIRMTHWVLMHSLQTVEVVHTLDWSVSLSLVSLSLTKSGISKGRLQK